MSDNVISSDNPLSQEDRDVLEIVVATMIPENAEYGVPGADDEAIFANILARAAPYHEQISDSLAALRKLSEERHGKTFPLVDFDDRVTLVNDFRSLQSASIRRMSSIAVQCYYLDDRVMASLGMDARAPYPDGFTVEQGDWSLLDPVRKKQKLYREVS
jgi:hypothetical protein